MVESATEGLSSGRFFDSFFGVFFSANQAQIMPAAESATTIQNSTCQLQTSITKTGRRRANGGRECDDDAEQAHG